jgi:hypothetical protein
LYAIIFLLKKKNFFNNIAHQLKRGYALNLSILVSAAQKQKLTRIPLLTASEVGNTENKKLSKAFCISPKA